MPFFWKRFTDYLNRKELYLSNNGWKISGNQLIILKILQVICFINSEILIQKKMIFNKSCYL